MFKVLKSHINIKLGASLALTLIAVMAGLTGIFFISLNEVHKRETELSNLYQRQNDQLRMELFALQARFGEIPSLLQTNPVPQMKAWAEQKGEVSTQRLEGADSYRELLTKRTERRDVKKPNKIVVINAPDGPAFAYGLFDQDGDFMDSIEVVVASGLSFDELRATADRISADSDNPDALRAKVTALQEMLIDDAIKAEQSRNMQVQAVEDLRAANQRVQDVQETIRLMVLLATIIGILIANLLVWLVNRQMITKALASLSRAIKSIENREAVEVSYTKRSDEIGALAKGIVDFQKAMEKIDVLRIEQEKDRAASEATLENRLKILGEGLENGMGSRVSIVTSSTREMVRISDLLRSLADDTRSLANESTGLAETSAAYTQEVMAASDELRLNTETISSEMNSQHNLTRQAATESEQVAIAMRELEETAKSIGGIVSLIEKIAEQTNLLSLNATIEASRAGKAGAGFAVVAGEVKKLSAETGEATQTIAKNVENLRSTIKSVSQAVTGIQTRVKNVSQGVSNVTQSVSNLTRETSNIASRIKEVSENACQVATVNTRVETAASETGAMTIEMSELTTQITEAVQDMQDELRRIMARENPANAGAVTLDPDEYAFPSENRLAAE